MSTNYFDGVIVNRSAMINSLDFVLPSKILIRYGLVWNSGDRVVAVSPICRPRVSNVVVPVT